MTSPSTPAVTVIVPGFDVGEYAEDALASLRSQTREDWVAILIDDASTDDTGAIFDAAAAADGRFRVVHHRSRAGLGAARNTGLDLVETPFVGFLDADDRLTPRALERLVGTLTASGSDFAVGAYVRLRPEPDGGYAAGVVQPWVAAATDPARTATTLDHHPEAGLMYFDFRGRCAYSSDGQKTVGDYKSDRAKRTFEISGVPVGGNAGTITGTYRVDGDKLLLSGTRAGRAVEIVLKKSGWGKILPWR